MPTTDQLSQPTDLGGLIQSTPYQVNPVVAGVPGGPGTPDAGTPAASGEGASPAVATAPNAAPTQTQAQPGVTSPASLAAEEKAQYESIIRALNERAQSATQQLERTNAMMQSQVQLARERENAEFERRIADLDEADQQAARSQRRLQELEAENGQLRSAQERAAYEQNLQQQVAAKRWYGMQIAVEHGLNPEMSRFLMGENTPEGMHQAAAQLAQSLTPAQQQQLVDQSTPHAQAQQPQVQLPQAAYLANQLAQQPYQQYQPQTLNRPVDLPTGELSSAPPVPQPQERSGDLQGFIRSRSYSLIPEQEQ